MTVQGKVNYLDTSFLDILPLQRNWHQSLANLWEMMKKEKSASLFWEEVNNRSNSVKHFPEAVWKMRGHFSVGKVNSFCVCVLNDLFPCLYSYEKYPPPPPQQGWEKLNMETNSSCNWMLPETFDKAQVPVFVAVGLFLSGQVASLSGRRIGGVWRRHVQSTGRKGWHDKSGLVGLQWPLGFSRWLPWIYSA